MKSHRHSRRFISRQRGAALVISLLLLLVMTLLGLGASQSTRLQERMAGNQRDQEIALQGAEATLREAELELSPTKPFLKACTVSGDDTCDTYEMRTLVAVDTRLPLDLAKQTDEWWSEWAREYRYADDLDNVATTPELVVERYAEIPDVLSVGDSTFDAVREFYTVTARSSGQTATAQAVIQSTYARLVLE